MSYADYLFVKNCKDILEHGDSDEQFEVRPKWSDGTPAHTMKKLFVQNMYTLSATSIPVMTLRQTGFKNAIDEVLWIYQRKSNNVHDLKSHIWDSWTDEDGSIGKAYGYQIGIPSKHHVYHAGEDLDGLKFYVKPVDGKDWVFLSQTDAVLWDLKNNPGSRSIMTNTYVHTDLADMGLRPCAYSMHYIVTKGADGRLILNGKLIQRSQDMLTANNWNVVQYAVLLQMFAQVAGMQPGTFVHSFSDMHIYDRHIPIIKEMIRTYEDACDRERADFDDENDPLLLQMQCLYTPYSNPEFWINPEVKNFYDFTLDDFALKDYKYCEFNHKFEVAV